MCPHSVLCQQRVSFATPSSVKVIRDLSYAERSDTTLDLYLPDKPIATPPPLIVVIHGGGWTRGDKESYQPIAAYLADQGYATASINYGLLPDVQFPVNIQHCKTAVRWLRANASTYHFDPNKFGVMGGSAGAHLAAMVATSSQVQELEGSTVSVDVSSSVQAFVGMATPVEMVRFKDRIRISDPDGSLATLVSPKTHISKATPPTLLMHGTRDGTVPPQHSNLLVRELKANGIEADLTTFDGAPHAFWNFEPWFEESMKLSVEFFGRTLN